MFLQIFLFITANQILLLKIFLIISLYLYILHILINYDKLNTKSKHFRLNNIYCKNNFIELLSLCGWMDVYNNYAVDDPCWPTHILFFLLIFYLSFYNECFPLISTGSSLGCKQPWMTSVLLKSCRTKNKLCKSFNKHPTSQNKSAFITYRNGFSKLKMAAEKSYYNNIFSE